MKAPLYIALGTVGLLWGSSFLLTKLLLQDFEPWTITFYRSLFGTLGLLFFMVITKKRILISKVTWIPLFFATFLGAAFPWILVSYSQTLITTSMSGVLNATVPYWTLILGSLFFGFKVGWKQWLGVSLGFIGILLLTNIQLSDQNIILGITLMSIVAMCYSLTALLTKKYLSHMTIYQVTLFTLFQSSVLNGIIAIYIEPYNWLHVAKVDNILLLFCLGTLGSGLGYILYFFMILEGSVVFATLVTYIIPIVALLLGVLFLNEPLTLKIIIGFVFVLLGIIIAEGAYRIKNLEKKRAKINSNKGEKQI